MADDGDGKIDPKAQHELNLMTEAMRDCKIKKAGQGDLTCLMERCDGTPFVVRLSSGGKGVLAKQVLRTFCKQHVKRCPDDDWWANEKDCALLQADDMMGDADWALDPNSSANDDGRKQGHFLVRRAGQTTSFAALARQLSKARDADDGAAKESELPNFKGSDLGRFPLVLADFWTSDHLLERPRSVDAFFGTRARGTLTLKRR